MIISASIGSLLVGVLVGVALLAILPKIPLSPRSSILKVFGIRKPVVMGFLPYWLIAKTSTQSLSMINDATYFGLNIGRDGHLVKQVKPGENEPGWQILNTDKFSDLVKRRFSPTLDRSLLVNLSNDATISALLSDPVKHAQTLVGDADPLMKKYGFTDLNLDIESFRMASPSAQAQMSVFLRQVRKSIDEHTLGTVTTELTVASLVKDQLLVPEVVGEVSDRVVLMAYDFHYRGSTISGPVSPIGGGSQKWEYDVRQSVQLATQAIPAHKIILGIPLYGYEWETLTYQPESAVIPGTGKTSTILRVEEIRKKCSDCVVKRDELSGSPFLILPPNDDSAIQQIYFEDDISLQQKVELAKEYKLGGIAFWAIGYENEGFLDHLREYRKITLAAPNAFH